MKNEKSIIENLRKFQFEIVDNISKQMKEQNSFELSKIAYDVSGDSSYAIDANLDKPIDTFFRQFGNNVGSCLLISEGAKPKPFGAEKPEDCKYVVIIDPVDGTRGLMYNMTSAWTLAGVALNKSGVSLKDIEIALQTELPTTKQYLFDSFVGVKNRGVKSTRHNILTGDYNEWKPEPSKAKSIKRGFAMLSKFFEGSKTQTAEIEEQLYKRLNLFKKERAMVFDEEYIASGGQFSRLSTGAYRFCGDLRPLFSRGLCAHPYDVCTEIIPKELGVEVTDINGNDLCPPLDTTTDVAWLGYANKSIRKQVEPVLQEVLKEKIPSYMTR